MLRFWKRKQEEPPPVAHREVPVRVLTPSGWISGTLHLPGIVRVADFVHQEVFLRLTDARFDGDPQVVGFLALKRDAIILLIVDANENLESGDSLGYQDEHRVTCWFESGAVQGVMLIRLGSRLSDYLERHEGLVVIRECHYRIRNPLTMKVEEDESWAILLNPKKVVAVTEAPQTDKA